MKILHFNISDALRDLARFLNCTNRAKHHIPN